MSLDAFRIREIEDKMREAALQMDFERAITLRDQAREMRSEQASSTAPERPKVVDLRTRTEHVPDEVDPVDDLELEGEDIAGPQPNPETISRIETLLEQAQNGTLQGIAAIITFWEPNGPTDIDCIYSDNVLDHVRLFVGGAHTLAADLLAVEQDLMDFEQYDEAPE